MTRYLKAVDGEIVKYPYTRADFQADHPHTSIPPSPTKAQLAEFDVYELVETTRPPSTTTYDIVEGTPVEDPASIWTQTWVQVAVSPEETTRRELAAREEADKADILADSFVGTFIAMSPAQIEGYIDANVTDLASARNVMKKMAKMVLLLARREFG